MSRPASLLKLEQDAYYAVLRALAVNELDWTKEKLLTDLRKVLNISNDMHFKFLEDVMEDKLITRLQESRNSAQQPVAPSNFDMPPPPRQQPGAQPGPAQRKPGRPASGSLKNQASLTSPLGARASRAEPTASGEQRRGRPSLKRDRDEGFEPKRSHVKSFKTSLGGGRSRGRGRRIPGLTREVHLVQPVSQRYTRLVPFEGSFLRDKIENAPPGELEEMHTALALRDQAISNHLDLIQQLEDDTLLTNNPLKYCQLLIQELELAEERINNELDTLKSNDED